jgi:hypothetical protein
MKMQNVLETNLHQPIPMLMSKLWVFLSLNYIYCDVLNTSAPGVLQGLLDGKMGGMNVSQGLLLFAGISLSIPFVMVLLSTILPYRTNRIANIAAAAIMIPYQLVSFLFGTETTLHYVYFSVIEILGNAVILTLALRWKKSQ